MEDKKINDLIHRLVDYIDSLIKVRETEKDSQYIAENTKALAMLLIAKALNDEKL